MSNIKNIKDAPKNTPPPGAPQNLEPIECSAENCNSTIFMEARKMGKLSALHPSNKSGKLQLVPFQVFICAECGTPLQPEE